MNYPEDSVIKGHFSLISAGLTLASLFLVCFYSAAVPFSSQAPIFPTAERPPDVPMNEDAGFGGWVVLDIHLAGGQNFPVVVDTGCPTTCLDTSFEPKLGKRIKTDILWDFGVKSEINIFLAPKLFLGKTPLMKIGPYVVTHECKQISSAVGRPVFGILGMDVLQNYCIQLDFAARKIRFLDYEHENKSRWGTPLALVDIGDGCVAINDNLAGAPGPGSLVDTGYNQDGWLEAKLFEQWTNRAALSDGEVHSPRAILGGQIYPEVNLRRIDPKLLSTGDTHIKINGLGLRLMARHLVTLDFPEQTLYLKPISNGSPNQGLELEKKSAAKFLKSLERQGKLPGWAKSDSVAGDRVMVHYAYPFSFVFDIPKSGDPRVYHYTISRASADSSWQLTKAWQTDAMGAIVREYPVP